MSYGEKDREGGRGFWVSATMEEAIMIPGKTPEENSDPR